jgi:two-component sensor histidine kinase
VLDAAPVALFVVADRRGRLAQYNRKAGQLLHHPGDDATGADHTTVWEARDEQHQRISPDDLPVCRTFATGLAQERVVQLADGAPARWVRMASAPVCDTDGRPGGAVLSIEDIDDERRALQTQRLLVRELNHRVKNMLANVHAIAVQTGATAHDVAGYRQSLVARLLALGRAHDLLVRESWQKSLLTDLAAAALEPWCGIAGVGGRLTIEGPEVWLHATQTVALALALHELATNAVQHGALSMPGGQVKLEWWVEMGRVTLSWRESGGPMVTPPVAKGFGTRLIGRGLAAELDGTTSLNFAAPGLHWQLVFPLRGDVV